MTMSNNTSISTVVPKQPQIQEFEFNTNQIRVIDKDGELWFVAVDVCTVLGIQNPTDAIKKRLDDDEYALDSIYTGASSSNQAYLVNESGLYSLVLGSKKKAAKEFKRWVTHEVLPSIRKTGSYSVNQQPQLDALSTKTDREPLTNLVNTLVSAAPLSYRDVWHMVKAELKTTKKAAEFTIAEVHRAIEFAQRKIDQYCAHDDIITEQALKGTKAFIVRVSVEEPAKSKSMTLVHRQFKATVYITEEQAPHEISTQISHMLHLHHGK